jgi:hypothetical protein
MSNQGYHISKGADNVFYILNDGETYLCKLSKDLSKAKKIATDKIKQHDPDFFEAGNELIVNIWNRKSWSKEQKPKWLPIQESHISAYYKYIYKLKFEENLKLVSHRKYVGNVGDVIELELEMIDSFSFSTEWGGSWCYKFKDSKDNRFVYFGTSSQLSNFKENGDKSIIKFQIKKQFIDEKYDIAPYKLNQIEKPKSSVPICKYEFTQIDNYKIGIREIWVEYFSKKDYKFYFIDNDNKKILFYPKNIKTFKAAKELLYDLSDLNNEGKLSKDYLININN